MAVNFSRPDPSSPAAVAEASFPSSRRGFDQSEVRDFLRMVAAELGRLQERERFLERELRTAQTNPDFSSARLDDSALTRLLGEETARVLTTARESATEIREKAEQNSARLLAEANDEARRVREEADVEAARRRSDSAADAEAEVSMAKQQGREMVNEARAYRERVLSELARRRELAREQIEQLIHGRDRLIQVFERARLVAGDIVGELQPLGEPDEYVNLSPTTGPVPVMVKNSSMAALPTQAIDRIDDDESAAIFDQELDLVRPGQTLANEVAEVEADDPVVDDLVVDDLVVDDDDAEDVADDDVVVDLFARLRAGSEADVEPEILEPEIAAEVDEPEIVAEVDDEEPNPFRRRDADLTPLIVSSARKLKRVLADEQNGVLDALRRQTTVRDVDDVLPSVAEHRSRYTAAIADDLLVAAHAGASLVGENQVASLPKKEAAAAVRAANTALSDWLIEPLRERLTRAVLDGDGDTEVITKRVRAVYRECKTQHIDAHLDDVVRTAHGRGLLGAVASGDMVAWTPDDVALPCADCNDNVLAGPMPAGEAFPTGHTFAPPHPGCRCLLLPIGQ